MARTSNATQLSAALTRAEMAETALADALRQIDAFHASQQKLLDEVEDLPTLVPDSAKASA